MNDQTKPPKRWLDRAAQVRRVGARLAEHFVPGDAEPYKIQMTHEDGQTVGYTTDCDGNIMICCHTGYGLSTIYLCGDEAFSFREFLDSTTPKKWRDGFKINADQREKLTEIVTKI